MAQIKIYGRSDTLPGRRDALSDVLHSCVVDAFDFPEDKRAHRFFYLEAGDMRAPAGRSSDYVIIEIALFAGRTVRAKKNLYALVFERFERELGMGPVDVEMILTETPRHDWAMRGRPGDEVDISYRVDV